MALGMLSPSSELRPVPQGNSELLPPQDISAPCVEGGKFSCVVTLLASCDGSLLPWPNRSVGHHSVAE